MVGAEHDHVMMPDRCSIPAAACGRELDAGKVVGHVGGLRCRDFLFPFGVVLIVFFFTGSQSVCCEAGICNWEDLGAFKS